MSSVATTEGVKTETVTNIPVVPLRIVRRNFALFFLDYVFFGTAFGLMGVNTVIPKFVSNLTPDQSLIGLISSLYLFVWLIPQLIFAQMINRMGKSTSIMWMAIPFRIVMVFVAIAMAVIDPANKTLLLVVFLIGYLLFAVGDGLITIAWADLIGSTIPNKWRGVLFGGAQIVVAFTALITREIAEHLLGPQGQPFPDNFAQVFGVAAAMFVIAGICLASLAHGAEQQKSDTGPTLRQYLPYLGTILRTDRQFQRFILTRMLFDLTMMSAPFYVLFGSQLLAKTLNVSETDVTGQIIGNSILISTAGSAVGALFLGWFSHRSGSRSVLIVATIASCLHPILALLSFTLGIAALYGAFFILGFIASSTVPGFFDWVITHAPPERRPIYIGLTNTISAVSHLAPFFGGVILGATSYPILFIVALTVGVLGTVTAFFISEPRHRLSEVTA